MMRYDFYTDEECHALTDSLFFVHSEDTDTLLRTRRPNIVTIIMESCGGQFTEMGEHPEITPHFNQLAHEGIYFTECYFKGHKENHDSNRIIHICKNYENYFEL